MTGPKLFDKLQVMEDPKEILQLALTQCLKKGITFNEITAILKNAYLQLNGALTRDKNNKEISSAMMTLANVYLKFNHAKNNKNETVESFQSTLQSSYAEYLPKGEDKENVWYTDAGNEKLGKMQKDVGKFLESYEQLLIVTSPTMLHSYGKNDKSNLPQTLSYLKTKLDSLITDYGQTAVFAEIKKQAKEKYASEKENPYSKFLVSGLSGDSVYFMNSLATLTKTQRSIDALNMLLKAKLFGGKVEESEIKYLLEKLELGSKTINDLLKNCQKGKGNAETFENALTNLFESIKNLDNYDFVNLAFEVNYGEGCKVLGMIADVINPSWTRQADAFSMAEYFFTIFLPGSKFALPSDLEREWSEFTSRYSGIANNLLSDEVSTPPGSDVASVKRGKYDVPTIIAILIAQKKGDIQNIGYKQLDDLIELCTSTDDQAKPGPVAATLFLNSGVLSLAYDNFKKNPQDFTEIASFIVNGLVSIYNQPFGTYGNVNRTDKANLFMKNAEELFKKPELLNDIVARFMTNSFKRSVGGYNHIGFQNPLEQIFIPYGQEDETAFQEIMNSYIAAHKMPSDLLGNYDATLNYLNSNPIMPGKLSIDPIYWDRLLKSRHAIMAGLSENLAKILATGQPLKFEHIDVDTDIRKTDETTYIAKQESTFNMYFKNGGSWQNRLNQQENGYYDESGNFISTKSQYTNFNSSMKNLGIAEWRVYNAFANIYKRDIKKTEGELEENKVIDKSMLLWLNGAHPNGGMQLFYQLNENDAQKFENLGVFLSVNGNWYYFDMVDKLDSDFEGAVLNYHQKYGETYNTIQNIGTYGAFETLGKIATGVLGFENLTGDTRFAALYGASLERDQGAFATLSLDNSSSKPVIVTSGVVYFNKDDFDRAQNRELEDIRKNSVIQTNQWGRIKDPRVVSTTRVLAKKFEAIGTFGLDYDKGAFIGGRYSQENMTFGSIMHFRNGLDFYLTDGRFYHEDIAGSLVVSGDKHKVFYANGVLTIKIDEDRYITLSGVYGNPSQLNSRQLDNLSLNLDQIADLVRKDFDETTWNNLPENERKQKLQNIASLVRAEFDRFQLVSPIDDINNIKNEFSFTYTDYSKKLSTKLSYTRVFEKTDKGEWTHGFVTNVTSIGFGPSNNKRIDIAVGLPVLTEDHPSANIQSLAGFKVNLDGIAFGMVGYNLFRDDAMVEATVAAEVYDDFLVKFTAKAKKEGNKFELFMGNKLMMGDYSFSNLKGSLNMQQHELNFLLGIGSINNLGYSDLYAGFGTRYTYAPGFIGREVNAKVTYFTDDRYRLDGTIFFRQDTHDGSLRVINKDFGVRISASIFFR